MSVLVLCVAATTWADNVEEARQSWAQGELRTAGFLLKNRLREQPDDIDARLLLAAIYLDYMQGQAAEQEVRRAQRIGASRGQTQALLGRALLLQGRYQRLLDEVRVGVVSEPTLQAELAALRGDAERGLGDADAARAEYARALDLDPRQADALVGMARLALAERDVQTARQLLVDATQEDPTAVRLWELLGEVELGLGDYPAAEQALVKAVVAARVKWMPTFKRALVRLEKGDTEAAATDIDAVMAQFPDFPGLLLARGWLLILRGEADEGLALVESYRGYDPSNARTLYALAIGEAQRGNLVLAKEHLRAYLALLPRSVPAHGLLAEMLLAEGEPAKAEEVLRAAISASPDRPELLAALARALDQQGRVADSLPPLLRAVQLAPDRADYHIAAADGLYRTGNHRAALAQLDEVLRLDPLHRTAPLLQIKILLEQERSEAALELATRLSEARSEDPLVLNALGLSRLANRDPEGADAAFAAALDIDPRFPDAALNLAKLALGKGDAGRARALLEQVVDSAPGHVGATLALAELDRAGGDVPGQQRRLRQAMEAFPQETPFRVALADSFLRAGSPEQARGLLQSAEERLREQPEMLRIMAQVEQALGDLDAAVELYDALQLRSPNSAEPYFLLADVHAERGDAPAMEQALVAGATLAPDSPLLPTALQAGLGVYKGSAGRLALLDKLVAATDGHPRITIAQADLLVNQRQYGRAAESMGALWSRYPDDPVVMRRLVGVLRAGQADDRAQRVLREWLERHPEDAASAVMLAQIQTELGDADAARALLEGLAAPESGLRSNPLILNNLAWLLRETDPLRARALAEHALRGAPSSASIMDTLGVLLLDSGEAGRALGLLESAHRAEPRDATIGFHYALALSRQGREAEARVLLLDLVEQRFPEHEAARKLLAELGG